MHQVRRRHRDLLDIAAEAVSEFWSKGSDPTLPKFGFPDEKCIRRKSRQTVFGRRIVCTESRIGLANASVNASRLLVTYLDRDMEFVWTPKHLDKMSWHRSSSVQIKPLQPRNSFFSANPATIRIDSLDFQSGRRSKREIVSESPSSERRLLWATS